MREYRFGYADSWNGLSLRLVDCHGKAEPNWELLSLNFNESMSSSEGDREEPEEETPSAQRVVPAQSQRRWHFSRTRTTRKLVRGFQRSAIDVEIMLGQHAGWRVFLSRIPLCPSSTTTCYRSNSRESTFQSRSDLPWQSTKGKGRPS